MVGPPLTPTSSIIAPPINSTPITEDALPALRRDMRKLRQHLHNEGKWQVSRVDQAITDLIDLRNIIGLYAPMSGEPDPASIGFVAGKVIARPALLADGSMVFRRWSVGDAEVKSPWGGLQPSDEAAIVEPDVILVPLVAFDAALNRVGQGGGHYDRYLAAHDGALRIGVAWEGQRVTELPVRHWDIPLDAVITEQNCYTKELRPCLIR